MDVKWICLICILAYSSGYKLKRNDLVRSLKETLFKIEDEMKEVMEEIRPNKNKEENDEKVNKNEGDDDEKVNKNEGDNDETVNKNDGDNDEKVKKKGNHISIVEWNKDHAKAELVEGDMKFNPIQESILREGVQGDFVKEESAKWDDYYTENGRKLIKIPFVYDNVTPDTKTAFQEAIDEYNSKTCIRFVPRTTESSYISVFNENGCWSYVGKQGGSQQLSLEDGGCTFKHIAVHEMKHALGYWHEQSRPDRDQYVTINLENIVAGAANNFDKMDSDTHNTPYDYDSVMHYEAFDFSSNGQPTILRKTGTPQEKRKFGNTKGLSPIDVQSLNYIYCKDDTTTIPSPSPSPVIVVTSTEAPTPTPTATVPTGTSDWDDILNDVRFCMLVKRERRFCRYCLINNACPGECVDMKNDCEQRMWDGECTQRIEYMSLYCSETCRSEYCGEDVWDTKEKREIKNRARSKKDDFGSRPRSEKRKYHID